MLSKRNTTIGAILIVLLFLLIIYLPLFIRMMHPFEVATLSVDKNVVETNDNKGSVQWRFKAGSDISFSKAIDIDRDDRNEVVLGTGFLLTDKRGKTKNGKDNARLYILNENGRLLFTTEIGMASIYPGGSSQWMIYDVHFLDIDGDTLIDLIALAVTDDSMDCILFTKTQKGGISKFWHAGKIEHTMVFNLSNEEKELICGAVNMRIGEKPVVFALHTNEYNDQSPPWGGNMRNRIDGLLWYRFLPGNGTIRRIEDKDSVSIIVETENGIEKHYSREGIEILKDEATEEMLKERREKYIECFREFEKSKRFEKENDIESALLSLNNAINMKVEDKALKASLYYEKGMLLYRKEKWKPSSVALNNAVKSDPLFYEAFNKLGEVYLEREKFNNATSSFKKAHILSGKETYFYRMVDCYTALGNYKTANNLLLRYDKNVKDKILFLFASAKVAREKGDFRTISLLYEKLIVLEPKNLIAYILLADTYADMNKNIEKADSLFTFSCTRDSSLFYKNIETSAWISYRKSRFEEAFQKINRAVEREESKKESSVASRRKLPRIYYRKAIIAQTLGEKEAKEEVIKRARSSPFCKGYVKKQINYLLASPK